MIVSLEPAGAVTEAAVAAGQGFECAILGVKNLNRRQGLGNFLAIGADILDRGGTGRAGNQAERFNTGQTGCDTTLDDRIPGLAAAQCQVDVGFIFFINFITADFVDQDQTGVTGVSSDYVAAFTDHDAWQLVFFGPSQGFSYFATGGYVDQVSRRAAQPHSRVVGQADILQDVHLLHYIAGRQELAFACQ